MKRKRSDSKGAPKKYKKLTFTKSLKLYSGPEIKNIDTDLGTTEFNLTGVVVPLNVIPIGTGSDERIGTKVTMKSIYIRGSIAPNSTNSAYNLCRMILVYDKQTNASLPSITSILNTANSHSQLNKDNRDRYDILMDKVYAVGFNVASNGMSSSPSFFSCKKFKKLGDRIVQFNQTNGGTISDITTGGLYLVFVGNTATGTTAASCTWTARVNYTDK